MTATILEQIEQVGKTLAETRREEADYLAWCARLARKAHTDGKSISEIARAAGVTRPTIYQWIKDSE